MDYDALADRARTALVVASMRRSTLTYGELAAAIDLDPNVPLPHHINRVLVVVSDRCIQAGEPSLAVLVVNQDTGKPGAGFVKVDHDWYTEARRCFRMWHPA
jgi:hypothetical protein